MARRKSIQIEMTEGAIRVLSGGHVLTIANSAPPPDAEEDTDFFIRLDDIDHWDAPDQEIPIDIVELQSILEAIEEELERHGLSVTFE
ncbi:MULTISPECIES: Imm74 family immunity protein [Methylosinus]|uniref:Imm74 family immunity protein n=1 Tax=Methylosinus TaxID=425 RepID=UPI00037A3E71|nr:Imm74 family immunity protein [Methylosinus sp. LW4]